MEDTLILMVVLVALAIPITILYLLVAVWGLKGRVSDLEKALAEAGAGAGLAERRPPVAATPAPQRAPESPAVPASRPEESPAEPPAERPVVKDPWSGRAAPAAAGPVIPVPVQAAATAGATMRRRAESDLSQDRPLVFRADRIATLGRWLVQNWVYVLSAVSLGLAGIFLVQYGVQKGLLPPPLRVLAALALGGGLVAAGEWLRRRHGDADGATAYLPSTFSAAGITVAFAAILAARQMYGLIGPLPTFAGLLVVAGGALYLGWRHTPVLAAMGLTGAAAAPFLTGGSAESIDWLYGYAALIAAVGLGIDAFRRWAWISVLALSLGYGVGLLVDAGGGSDFGLALLATALPALTFTIPVRSLMPVMTGATVGGAILRAFAPGAKRKWPEFPVRLVAAAMLASVLILLAVVRPGGASLPAFVLLTLLAAGGAVWASRSPAVSDLLLLPVIGFVARLPLEQTEYGGIARDFAAQTIAARPPETGAPAIVSLLVLLAVVMAAAAGMRALIGPDRPRYWAVIAAAILPAAGFMLEVFWLPVPVLGAYPWALHAMAAAAMMTGLALMLARSGQKPGAAYATLSALVLIAFAMVITLSSAALTVALGVLLAVAAALDRQFRLPEMGWFIQSATAVLAWRLVVDPGLTWAFEDGPLWEVLLANGSAVGAGLAGLWLLRELDRPLAKVVLDSAVWVFAALLVDVLLWRLLEAILPLADGFEAWRITLLALPWLAVSLGQLVRARQGGPLRFIRIGLSILTGTFYALLQLGAVTIANPAAGIFGESRVFGPPVVDTLAIAYALPGIVLIVARRWLGPPSRFVSVMLLAAGAALLTLYAVLEIRSWFHARDLGATGVTQGELYTYTMAMMLTGAVLLWQALAKRSVLLRRLAMAVIGLTVAKVFLVDASGLTGLTRVASFLALGLSLAGLAWLNRWAVGRQTGPA